MGIKYKSNLIRDQLTTPILLLLGVFISGTLGYKLLNWSEWSFVDCAYMTVITLTTVGYGDVLGIENYPLAKFYTMTLMLTGMGIVLYAVSALTAFIVEGEMKAYFRENKMLNRISKLKDHYILCGFGATGHYVVDEFCKTGQTFVVIDVDESHVDELRQKYDSILCFQGDATEDETLHKANIMSARGIIGLLPSDKDNLFLVVTAKAINPSLNIAARAIDATFIQKLRNVGAQIIVSPNAIGGLRLASEILRPHVVSFLDIMMRDDTAVNRFGEVVVPENSHIVGKTLRDSNIFGETGLTVIAMKQPHRKGYDYNPTASAVIQPNSILIVIGTPQQFEKVNRYVAR